MLKQEVEPIATCVVRELTGETNLRDDDDAEVSPNSCYGRFCLGRGWRVTSTNNETILKSAKLYVFFDNCVGQNKKNYVLWLVPYLVEAGYFKTVNFNFLVVGHTKNACDRRFNNVKRIYNKSDIFSFDMCVDICNKS
jgi:hypothetical protein